MNRRTEREALDLLIDAVRAGQSQALVVHGDPGVGKTVLLEYLATQAHGFRVARAAGVESEMQLAFAGLHQLCAPMLHRGTVAIRRLGRAGVRRSRAERGPGQAARAGDRRPG
jgi:hypothetical protein